MAINRGIATFTPAPITYEINYNVYFLVGNQFIALIIYPRTQRLGEGVYPNR